MPNVLKYDDKKKWMKVCVPKMVGEGRPQKQAVAACFSMWRTRDKKDNDLTDYDELMEACMPVLMEHGHSHQEAMAMCDEIYVRYSGYDEDDLTYDWTVD